VMHGVFDAQYRGGSDRWTVGSACNQSGCFAHVTSDQGWSQVAQLSADRWTMVWVGRPDGMICADGTTAPANVTWSWDAESLVGSVSASHGAACGNPPLPPGRVDGPLTLVKIS
jgi:hypothetical protein